MPTSLAPAGNHSTLKVPRLPKPKQNCIYSNDAQDHKPNMIPCCCKGKQVIHGARSRLYTCQHQQDHQEQYTAVRKAASPEAALKTPLKINLPISPRAPVKFYHLNKLSQLK